ncbi:tyrosine-type recombinase/integrase [Paenisporosarcina macmurdoensis]|uniref:Tyrosine-type recombinase/integrase n=1 Tax=Paenisporosarcina macmurdoensis TaxID=212659 RepID=A0ABW1L9G9_9BACL
MAANKIEESIVEGAVIHETKITFGQFAVEWVEYYGTQAKISSVRARSIAMKQLVSQWEHLPLKITRHMYQSYINALSQKFSRNYIDSIHTTGNMIFKHAIRKDLLSRNPTEGFVMPKKQETVEEIEEEDIQEKFLELRELKSFLVITKEHGLYMDYLSFVTLPYTGLRLGELLALKWSDVDFTKKTMRITKTYYNPNNGQTGYQLLTPKTKKSVRIISLDGDLLTLFKKHRLDQRALKMKQRMVYQDNNFIFAENTGHPRNMKQVMNRLIRLLKRLDIDKHITPHSFRHTHTSLLIEAGAGVKEIQERLGHSDINTTMNIYAHKMSKKKLLRDLVN